MWLFVPVINTSFWHSTHSICVFHINYDEKNFHFTTFSYRILMLKFRFGFKNHEMYLIHQEKLHHFIKLKLTRYTGFTVHFWFNTLFLTIVQNAYNLHVLVNAYPDVAIDPAIFKPDNKVSGVPGFRYLPVFLWFAGCGGKWAAVHTNLCWRYWKRY